MLSRSKFPRLSIYVALAVALILLFADGPQRAVAQLTPRVKLDSPQPGDVLQGVISIAGVTEVEGFRSAEVAFAYQVDPTNTWFLIAQTNTPVKSGALASWDTTTISDGGYRLRLLVLLQDGQKVEVMADGLRVRNYLPVETATPDVRAGQKTPTPTGTHLPDFEVAAVTPNPQPTNPAIVTPLDLQGSVAQGAVVAMALLVLVGLYLALRAALRHY